jgi:NTE family protein
MKVRFRKVVLMSKLGIALGGGGVAGTAHIGVLYALEEAGIRVDCLAGCSSGAIIAALYAYGYTASELISMLPTLGKKHLDLDYINFIYKFLKAGTKISGFIKGEKIRNFVADKTGQAFMTDLKLPVSISATDLKEGTQVLFVSRPLIRDVEGAVEIADIRVADAVRASLSIPVLFKPYVYKDRVLIDGGLVDNCPVAAARALGADQVIAVDLVNPNAVNSSFDSIKSILSRTVTINLAMRAKYSTYEADFILQPEVGSVGVLDFSKLIHCFQRGYEHTRSNIKQIKNTIERLDVPENSLADALLTNGVIGK